MRLRTMLYHLTHMSGLSMKLRLPLLLLPMCLSPLTTCMRPPLCTAAHSSKWGVVTTVHNNLHSQHIPVPDGLAGCVIALNIIIPTASAHGFILHILNVYTPWDAGRPQPTPSQF